MGSCSSWDTPADGGDLMSRPAHSKSQPKSGMTMLIIAAGHFGARHNTVPGLLADLRGLRPCWFLFLVREGVESVSPQVSSSPNQETSFGADHRSSMTLHQSTAPGHVCLLTYEVQLLVGPSGGNKGVSPQASPSPTKATT